MKVSVVMPVFNEQHTVCTVIHQVGAALSLLHEVGKDYEIIVVDDGSSDETRARLLAEHTETPGVRLLFLPQNRGKGAAVSRGITESTGAVVVVQDADLEYDPRDLGRLLGPIFEGRADVVFGSRFRGETGRVLYFHHYLANRAITFLSNACTNLNLTDIEVGYKAFRGELVRGLPLTSQRFGFEPEVTARVAWLPGVRVYEVGVSYFGRTYADGKKLTWRDGVAAVWWVLKYNAAEAWRRPGSRSAAPPQKRS